jgi:GT2 family glycosyltransferase
MNDASMAVPEAEEGSAPSRANSGERLPRLGVVVVTYRAADFIAECLESLLATGYPDFRVVVVDNASPDGTAEAVRTWASGSSPFVVPEDWPVPAYSPAPKPVSFAEHGPSDPPDPAVATVTLFETGANLGFAGGVNAGLKALLGDPDIDRFWVLNPDAISEPQTPFALVRRSMELGRYAAIGGRMVYRETPDRIQIDAGRLRALTGTPIAVNLGARVDDVSMPPEGSVAFISGGSVMVSRAFIERAGLMDEAYFLYFEEVDWQLRRGDLPFGLAPDARVRHQAGASIGSAGESLKPQPFSIYFGARSMIRFVWRWWPHKVPLAYIQAFLRFPRHSDGSWAQFVAMLRGIHRLPPPKSVRAKLPESVWEKILG